MSDAKQCDACQSFYPAPTDVAPFDVYLKDQDGAIDLCPGCRERIYSVIHPEKKRVFRHDRRKRLDLTPEQRRERDREYQKRYQEKRRALLKNEARMEHKQEIEEKYDGEHEVKAHGGGRKSAWQKKIEALYGTPEEQKAHIERDNAYMEKCRRELEEKREVFTCMSCGDPVKKEGEICSKCQDPAWLGRMEESRELNE